ncbi:hypothetical protein CMUS01_12457 [Colletotrichum musicola]|uniref:Uncharacterized protein n=1 Tax=Colletotrichum musicola TaxID=2175873 RepID=A0A8H6JLV6_9PEZI|nr:hypothetical protein CMUS01_12457 [Colletotrichum musicola]
MSPNITRPGPAIPLTPPTLPPPGASSNAQEIIKQLLGLTRSNIGSKLKLVKRIPLEGEVWEPEGLVRLAGSSPQEERFWISAGEYTQPTVKYPNGEWRNGSDRQNGAGFAHFLVFDGEGKRVGDWVVSETGDGEYHNGGVEFDGRYVWGCLAEYRPGGTASVVRVDVERLEVERVFRVGDHLGGVVRDGKRLVTLNWGGRRGRIWDLGKVKKRDEQSVMKEGEGEFDEPEEVVINPSHWIDYQDCKFLGEWQGRSVMLCSGIATLGDGVEVGGLAIVDTRSLVPVWEVPFMQRTEDGKGVLMTKNPMDGGFVDGRVRLWFAPEEGRGAVYVFEVGEGA